MYKQSVVLCDSKKYVKAFYLLCSVLCECVCVQTCDGASSFFMNSIFILHITPAVHTHMKLIVVLQLSGLASGTLQHLTQDTRVMIWIDIKYTHTLMK